MDKLKLDTRLVCIIRVVVWNKGRVTQPWKTHQCLQSPLGASPLGPPLCTEPCCCSPALVFLQASVQCWLDKGTALDNAAPLSSLCCTEAYCCCQRAFSLRLLTCAPAFPGLAEGCFFRSLRYISAGAMRADLLICRWHPYNNPYDVCSHCAHAWIMCRWYSACTMSWHGRTRQKPLNQLDRWILRGGWEAC